MDYMIDDNGAARIECTAAEWRALAKLAKVNASSVRPQLARICISRADACAYATDGHRMIAVPFEAQFDPKASALFASPIAPPRKTGDVVVTWDDGRVTLRQGAQSVDVTPSADEQFPDCARVCNSARQNEEKPGIHLNARYLADAAIWLADAAKEGSGVRTPVTSMRTAGEAPAIMTCEGTRMVVIIMPVRA